MYRAFLAKACTYLSFSVYLLHSSVALDSFYISPAQNPTTQFSQESPVPQSPVNKGNRESKQHDGLGLWSFEGLLAPDGSISTAKLMIEKDPSFEILPVDNIGRSISYGLRSPEISTHSDNLTYPSCPPDLRDYIPCLKTSSPHLFNLDCHEREQSLQDCAIPTPANYARQFNWPASKYQVRQPNIPNVPLLKNREWQLWFQFHGSTMFLQPGDPNFPNGISEYFNSLSTKISGLVFGETVRVVLDIGCGAGNVAADLEMRGAITLSVPGEGSCDNGVQLILERGYPSILQAFNKQRMPYPNQAFDLIHCTACKVIWEFDDGLKLLEADRLLRAGGFFVWMDPLGNGTSWNGMKSFAKKICWKLIAKEGRIAVWEKPTNQSCYWHRPSPNTAMCGALTRPDISWNIPLQRCVQASPAKGGAESRRWPQRLEFPPSRLKEVSVAGLQQVKEEAYVADLNFWKENVDIYVAGFGKSRLDDIRNVLDMNAGFGGFATAVLLKKPILEWWVLNVVPVNMPDRLALIFDRGLIGVYHDWCESLSIHPRTFDLVHATAFFSKQSYIRGNRCSMDKMIQEIDRLLRPGGFVLIRDNFNVLAQVQALATAFSWKTMIIDTESGPKGKDKVLSCQKSFWRPPSR